VLELKEGQIALGHKQLQADKWQEDIQGFPVGSLVEGKIKGTNNVGVLVGLDHQMTGFIHNSEISWLPGGRSGRDALVVGVQVKAKVIGFDAERRQVQLSLKQVSENVWETATRKYVVGQKVTLPILDIVDFGIFVDMGEGLRGLIPQKELRWQGQEASQTYQVGESIDCVLLDIDVARGRATFGVKQLTTDPWTEFLASNPVGKSFEATIKTIKNFGAFAAINGSVEGLIHISQLSTKRIKTVEEVVHVGDTVKVTVLEVDAKRRRLSLSLIAEPFSTEDEKDVDLAKDQLDAVMADVMPRSLKDGVKPHD
jgi:small subunit ribosomal protein S1